MLSAQIALREATVALSALWVCATGTRSLEVAEQEPGQDAQDPVSAKCKMIGVAVAWDAQQIFFLPASLGTARQKSDPFDTCRDRAIGQMMLFKHRFISLQTQERL